MKEKNLKNVNKKENPEKDKISVVEEKLSVDKMKVKTGEVKLTKKIVEEDIPQNLTGFEEEVEVDVKKIGQIVDKPGEAVRTKGDTTIYSVYREQYVKQTILEEEVWVTKKRKEKTFRSSEKLRREVINIERSGKEPKKDE
ncbi:DUF2382 domain-containing protein [Salegentibacter sp. F188]|uniref:DUF2382 domain-containing protein n=1 Tax=Autumnicola patrickiae TaxID=3075591 RepID=A0ABU3E4Z1_9FLAO|nr:DUF2382 domain-containing protein [Salegentibacter sp. F188]MDT0691007.1 DUF2382 domain-containing protein [Salegentibacter sp. F188]